MESGQPSGAAEPAFPKYCAHERDTSIKACCASRKPEE